MASTTAPAALLTRLVQADPGRPRITVYDDTRRPTRGERIELSARVLATWVAKAANLLQDELDVAPGSTVRLALPAHWRTVYWALAVWSVGAEVLLPGAVGEQRVDVVVTDEPEHCGDGEAAVLVTLAALARAAAGAVPEGAIDEARDLATYGDLFEPWEAPEATDVALRTGTGTTSYADLVPAGGPPERVHTDTADPATLLATALRAWAGGGSLVLTLGTTDADTLAARLRTEGVTRRQ